MIRTCHEKFSSSKVERVIAGIKLGLDFYYPRLASEN
jgi:hypothetical protein